MLVCVVAARPGGVGWGAGRTGCDLWEVAGLASVVADAILRVLFRSCAGHVLPCGGLCVPSAPGPNGGAGGPYTKAAAGVCGSGDLQLPPPPWGGTLGFGRQLPPQLTVGQRPLGGGRGGWEGRQGGRLGRGVPWGGGGGRAPPNSWVCGPGESQIVPVSSIAPEGWGPKEGGNATSPLHSRGSPTKGTKSEVKTYARGHHDAPNISRYGSLVQTPK